MLWTAPWWLGFLLFLAMPMGISLYISFCDYPLLQPPVYVGGENYRTLLADDTFHKVLANTCIYAAFSIPLCTVLGILLASLLNQGVRGQAIFRTCIFVPTVVPIVATAMLWLWMLNPQFGLINPAVRPIGYVLQPIGVGLRHVVEGLRPVAGNGWDWLLSVDVLASDLVNGPMWLAAPAWAMAALVLVSLWSVGSPVVIYLAGLQEIPTELYEAARLDGASRFRQFWHVTLPGLSPVILFNVIIAIIATWQVFALPYVMMRGTPGPERATYFYTMYLFDNAFRYLKMGYASAMAWIQLLIIIGLTGLVFLVSRKTVYYRGA